MNYQPLQFLTGEQEAERKAFLARPAKVSREAAMEALDQVRIIYDVAPSHKCFVWIEKFLRGKCSPEKAEKWLAIARAMFETVPKNPNFELLARYLRGE